jgi:hypothetical protein
MTTMTRKPERKIFQAAFAIALFGGIANASAAVTVTISPGYSHLVVGQPLQFAASVSGSANTAVTWQVDNRDKGAADTGRVSNAGLYTAPEKLPVPAIATITAVSQADPSVSATATATLLARAASGSTYYVAPGGSDSNPGTIGEPWATIQHAADTAIAGDTVFARAGVYNEHVGFANSGSAAGGFITFANYPGETATLDGTGLDIPGGQYGLFTLKDSSYVIVTGFELRNYKTTKLSQVPIGIYLLGAGSNVQVIGNTIHDIATTAHTTPKQCGSDAFGMTVYGTKAPQAIESLAISGNEIFHTKTGCSETLSVDGNVRRFAIVSNLIHDVDNIGIGAIGFEGVSPDPAYDQARDGVIRGNTVYNITSYGNPDYGRQYATDGIYVDGGTNIVIEQNLVHTVDLGIELASEHLGHVSSYVTARNNLIYDGNSAGLSIGGYGARRGGTDHCTIVNNTLYNDDTKKTGSGEFQIQFYATNNVFENNILYAGPQSLLVNDFTDSEPAPATLDDNLYYAAIGAAKAKFVWQKKHYTGYANYLAASGQDADSLFSDPQFLDTGNPPDLDIAKSSPARDAGALLGARTTGTDDFAGNPRTRNGTINIGAYER